MRRKLSLFSSAFLVATLLFSASSCTFVFQKGRRADIEKISQLKNELSELERAKNELESRLGKEIADKEVNVQMQDRGLVITFVSEVLFDSGKAELREEAFQRMDKVADVLNTTVKDLFVGVEGHTDDQPIKYSGWANWELSSGRALSVVHYLIEKSVSPERLAAIGYSEYRPVESNDSAAGRQKNRRVEVVIIPKIEKEGRDDK